MDECPMNEVSSLLVKDANTEVGRTLVRMEWLSGCKWALTRLPQSPIH